MATLGIGDATAGWMREVSGRGDRVDARFASPVQQTFAGTLILMLILGATPIGNLGDVSERLRHALATVGTIAAEDTRSAIHLLSALDIENRPRLIAVHDHNESERAPELIAVAEREDVLVLSDAGMPTVSDPGFRLVQHAIAADVPVTVLPGPSAVLTALALSGLPTDRFAFDGFLPRKRGERMARLRELHREPRTVVLFESPHRVSAALDDLIEALGPDRPVALCRELTKLHEQVLRGSAAEVRALIPEGGVRGEVVLVVGGASRASEPLDLAAAVALVAQRASAGERLGDAAASVASETGFARRALYDGALAARR